MPHNKRPRHYAEDIIALPTREARLQALNAVPEQWRYWVKELVEDYFRKRAAMRRYQQFKQAKTCK